MSRHYLMRKVLVRKKNSTSETWASVANAIELKQVRNFSVRAGIGKTKDTFEVHLKNAKGDLQYTKYDGDGSTKEFQLQYYPIPTDYLDTELFSMKVGSEVYTYTSGTPSTNSANKEYTVSGSTVSFGVAPSTGTENITVQFKVVDTEDMVRIYQWTDSASESDSDIISEGLVNGTLDKIDFQGKNKTIKGKGLIDILFNVLAFYKQTPNTLKKSSEIIEDIIDYVNELNSQGNSTNTFKTIRWSTDNDATTKDIMYDSPYKRAIEIIEDLSSTEYTGEDKQYIYYVTYNATDDAYDFHFKIRPSTNSGTLAEGTDFASLKIDKNADEIINAAIYNTGTDCEGVGQEFLYIDFTAKGNSSWKYVNDTNYLFSDLLNKEFETDTSKWPSQTKDDGTKVRAGNYPTTTALAVPYTLAFNTRAATFPYNETTTSATASTKALFNQAVSDESRAIGWRKTQSIVSQLNDFRIEVSGEIPVHKISTAFSSGNLHTMNIESAGLTNKDLRIETLKYNMLTTDPDFKEDEDEV